MNTNAERCQAYETVAQAIRFVRQHAARQPGLDEIADQVGLSPFHLQRIFSAWAGISPKRFLQHLTKNHATALLRENHDVLTAALETGLSGPSRLHDLTLACDAVTPGEVRALGAGLHIHYGFGATPFGRAIVGTTYRGICALHFTDSDDEALAALKLDWPQATLVRKDQEIAETLARIFAVGNPQAPVHLLLRGTNFQVKVWEALLRIPPGTALSYRKLAGIVGNARAQRAVGTALAHNRIAFLIPCHRVLRENGEIGQYRWGSERKHAMLALESATRVDL